MNEPREVLRKLARAIKPVHGVLRWWPFPLHTQQSLRLIFTECHSALAAAIEENERLRGRIEALEREVGKWRSTAFYVLDHGHMPDDAALAQEKPG